MSKEEVKNKVGATVEAVDDSQEKTTAKKEIWPIRWAKAIGSGISNACKSINGFSHEHPYILAGIGTALGFIGKMGLDLICADDASEDGKLELPETAIIETEFTDYEPEPMEIDIHNNEE